MTAPRLIHPHHRGGGFTLVEALAVLVFIGIVIPVVLSATGVATRAGSTAARRIEATMLAEAKLEEILATRDWEEGGMEGNFDQSVSGEQLARDDGLGPGDYAWQLTVEDGIDLTLRQLRLRVTWQRHGAEHAVELVTQVREAS